MSIKSKFIQQGKRLLVSDAEQCSIVINNVDYIIYNLNLSKRGNKGAHSNVFRLYLAQDFVSLEESVPVKVIKISNEPDVFVNGKIIKSDKNRRFYREIQALKECKERDLQNVITLDYDDHIVCEIPYKRRTGEVVVKSVYYPFYMMNFAEYDLKSFLEENSDLTNSERLELCIQLAKGLKELNDLGYYHRDIKPDNILMFGNTWKIGDLGLVAYRNEDWDDKNEFIGPKGWISPEAMNKYLSEGVEGRDFDCRIDQQSDIFQLGKVFWYILQGNAPIGCISRNDFLNRNESIYTLIRTMINYSKKKRITKMEDVISELERIMANL